MRRTPPWWLGWLLAGGLLAIFLGERVLAQTVAARAALTGLGALAVLAAVVLRFAAWRGAEGEARRVEGALLLAYAGCLLALLLYAVSSEDGARLLGVDEPQEGRAARVRLAVQVLWTLLLAISLLPALGAQLALGRHRRGGGETVEAIRLLESMGSGLVVGLAGAALMLFGYVTSARDKTIDLSYFKTATPGTATEAAVKASPEPIRVLMFFPEVNPVKDEVVAYFRKLADATGRIEIEELDRLTAPKLAEQYQITQDGTVLFVRGDRQERIDVGTEMATARTTLRGLDRRVQSTIMPILRQRPHFYLTTGHGELNDSTSAGPVAGRLPGQAAALRQLLGYLGYDVQELGLVGGLGKDIPQDATVVMVLGPRRPFLPEEMDALVRYLDRGGSLALALDPDSGFRMGPLEQKLAMRYVPEPLADEQQHMQQRGDDSDRRLIATDQFSSHASVTTLARAGMGAGVLWVGPGHLERIQDLPIVPIFVVRSLQSTFADLNRDYRFDQAKETQSQFNLEGAIDTRPPEVVKDEAPPSLGGAFADSLKAGPDSARPFADSSATAPFKGARALVFASSSVFSDAVLVSIGPNAALVADGMKWLAREEALAGSTETEEDKPVVHTRGQDVGIFYAAILGAPVLLLAGGLAGVYRRRRTRPAGAAAVEERP